MCSVMAAGRSRTTLGLSRELEGQSQRIPARSNVASSESVDYVPPIDSLAGVSIPELGQPNE
jgi:hypothetical protein